MKATIRSIGVIQTPYTRTHEIPRQGVLEPVTEGRVVLKDAYKEGLEGLNTFSHAVLIFYFHQAREERLKGTPPWADKERGVFAIRGPHRPNRLGLSVVKIHKITPDGFVFSGVDMLDGTPLIDIKPYVNMLDPLKEGGEGFQGRH